MSGASGTVHCHTDAAVGECGVAPAVLSVRELGVRFEAESGSVAAVRGVSFTLQRAESLAIVGESGAGKSAAALGIMGLHPSTVCISGSVRLHGEELLERDDLAMSRLRGRSLSMIFQDPLSALTPVYTVGEQIVEALRAHQPIEKAAAMRRAVELLDLVGIPDARRRAGAFPHEFSGGMRQRAMIAMAMANQPDVIIADEPTTALDVTIQAQVLEVLKKACEETHAALILITHDLGIVAGIADRVIVMYAGRAVEQCSVRDLFHAARMPYTLGLYGALPRPDRTDREPLAMIPGQPPALHDLPPGCAFAPRCPLASDACFDAEPPLALTDRPEHLAACFHSERIAAEGLNPRELFPCGPSCDAPARASADPGRIVLAIDAMARHYPLFEGSVFRRRVGSVRAVDGIDLVLAEGETLGLVGESGCGKSTTVQAIMALEPPTRGTISLFGSVIGTQQNRRTRRDLRRRLQVVFQDPSASLDPRMPVYDLIGEPLGVFGVRGAALGRRVEELLALVDLDMRYLERYPGQLSGGQRQRVGIARALALEPQLLILDEPVSALDVSIRAGIINLLDELKARLGLSYLFVAHDLALVRHLADRVAVMYLGTILETGDVDSVYERPSHPYTQALLSAMPVPDPDVERRRRRILLRGEAPNPVSPPSGCRFHTRCPLKPTLGDAEQRRCVQEMPELAPVHTTAKRPMHTDTSGRTTPGRFVETSAHSAACHFKHRSVRTLNDAD